MSPRWWQENGAVDSWVEHHPMPRWMNRSMFALALMFMGYQVIAEGYTPALPMIVFVLWAWWRVERSRQPSTVVTQPGGRIEVLLDRSASLKERGDAARDLADFDTAETVAALVEVGSDDKEHEMILESVGETLGELVRRQPNLRADVRSRLSARALAAFKFAAEVS